MCIVDTDGSILRSYGGRPGSAAGQLNCPRHLAVDASDHVFVADYNNNKVRLFSLSLTHLGDVTLPGQQLHKPWRLHLDESGRYTRLYVIEALTFDKHDRGSPNMAQPIPLEIDDTPAKE